MKNNYKSTLDQMTPKVGTINNIGYHFAEIYANLQNIFYYFIDSPYVSPVPLEAP